jgi:hypothetical protein
MTRINLIHAAFDAGNVDICLDGDVVLSDMAHGDYADFCRFAGCCFNSLQVKLTGTSTVLACLSCFVFPSDGDYSLVIQWNEEGDEGCISCYNNCVKGKGNFLFRHVAAVGKVNVCKTDITPVIQVYTNVEQGAELHASFFPEGTNKVVVKLSADSSELITVSDLEIKKDKLTILYLTGRSADGYSSVTEEIDLPPKRLAYWHSVYQGLCDDDC